jgi:hypothetical protein
VLNSLTKPECLVYQTGLSGFYSSNSAMNFVKFQNRLFTPPPSSRRHQETFKKDTNPFRPKEEGEEVLGQEYPYLSVIGALMYLANNTKPDIAFIVNYLARHSAAPTMRHWNGIKNIMRYLIGTIDFGLDFHKKTRF